MMGEVVVQYALPEQTYLFLISFGVVYAIFVFVIYRYLSRKIKRIFLLWSIVIFTAVVTFSDSYVYFYPPYNYTQVITNNYNGTTLVSVPLAYFNIQVGFLIVLIIVSLAFTIIEVLRWFR